MSNKKYEKGKFYKFKFDAITPRVESINSGYEKFIEKAISDDGHNVVIAIGDRFMRGVFISKKELKLAHKGFNNTLHDLNHMGSGYQISMFESMPPDISYFVGWQDNALYDEKTGEVRAQVHIEKAAPRYKDWENYVNISSKIGRTPNVSMYVFAQVEYIQARDLPKGSGYSHNGYKADDLVPCFKDIQPFMVSTVTMGACNDMDGCGIENGKSTTDTIEEINDPYENVDMKEVEKQTKESKQKIEFYKNRIKDINGE